MNIIDEYNDFIKEIQLHNKKSYSIFYRIECRSFLEGKYKYYKIYITNDLLSEDNLNDRKSNGKNYPIQVYHQTRVQSQNQT